MSDINYWGVEGYIDTSGSSTQSWSDTVLELASQAEGANTFHLGPITATIDVSGYVRNTYGTGSARAGYRAGYEVRVGISDVPGAVENAAGGNGAAPGSGRLFVQAGTVRGRATVSGDEVVQVDVGANLPLPRNIVDVFVGASLHSEHGVGATATETIRLVIQEESEGVRIVPLA